MVCVNVWGVDAYSIAYYTYLNVNVNVNLSFNLGTLVELY